MKRFVFYFFLIPLYFFIGCNNSNEKQTFLWDLKLKWEFKQSSENQWQKAIIPGDISCNLNSQSLKKLSNKVNGFSQKELFDWEFQTIFNIDKSLYSYDNIDFLCNVSGNALIYLNDSLLNDNNKKSILEIPCKRFLKLEGNYLKIVFKAPINPGDGIWEPVKFKGWQNAKIKSTIFNLTALSEKRAQYNAEITIEVTSDVISNIDILVNQKHVIKLRDLLLSRGINKQSVSFTVQNPKLWWTNGLGQPNQYNVTVRLQVHEKSIEENISKLNVRKFESIKLNLEGDLLKCIRLNHKDLFIKGVCFIPSTKNYSDTILKNYKQIIEAARKTNINYIYTTSPLFFGKDYFMSLCDENGIIFSSDSSDYFFGPINRNDKKPNNFLNSCHSGYYSPPSLKMMIKSADTNCWKNNFIHPGCYKNGYNKLTVNILDSISKYYSRPNNLKSFIYFSQILQSSQVKAFVENSRLNTNCGIIYNQFNDTGYNISESVLDYNNNWKPVNYKLKDAFSSCIIIPVSNKDMIDIFIVNDELKEIDGILLCRLIDFYGKDYYVKQIPVSIKANSVFKAVTILKKNLFSGLSLSKACMVVQLNRPGQMVAQNILYFALPKNLILPSVKLKKDINVVAKSYNLILKSDVLVKNVVLDTKSINATFSDNNFDLLPGKRTKISVLFKGTQQELEEELEIMYLNLFAN